MKCIQASDELDVCVTVSVKLIYKHPASGDLEEELQRKDMALKAAHLGQSQEEAVALSIGEELMKG